MNESKQSKLSIYMPLIQQLSKYAFFLLCLIIFASRVITLLDATEQRLLSGGEISIGPSGIKFGEAPKMPPQTASVSKRGYFVDPLSNIGTNHDTTKRSPVQGAPTRVPTKAIEVGTPIEESLHLVHGAAKQKSDYTVKVKLESTNPDAMRSVQKVIYHLHNSFQDPMREVTNGSNGFELSFTAWGQFEIKAYIYVKGKSQPIELRRWLNF